MSSLKDKLKNKKKQVEDKKKAHEEEITKYLATPNFDQYATVQIFMNNNKLYEANKEITAELERLSKPEYELTTTDKYGIIMKQNAYYKHYDNFTLEEIFSAVLYKLYKEKMMDQYNFMLNQGQMGKLFSFSEKNNEIFNYYKKKREKKLNKQKGIQTMNTGKKIKTTTHKKIKIVVRKEEIVDVNKLEQETDLKVFNKDKPPMNVIFIGHVDSGKSTICGSILYHSGAVSKEELQKYEQEAKAKAGESWYLAFLMDINEEERVKGKTVEVGRIDFETNTKRFTLLDCPGHHNFVPNMIGGAAQADVACLVISARAGEFEAGFEKNGQTREHAMLAKSLGCKYIIILVNKLDSVDWDEKRYYSILEQVTPFLINNCGFEKENIFNVGISGLKGQNMKDFVPSEICNWYKDKTLFNMLDTLPTIDRSKNEFVRLPVLDLFRDMGNTYIFGKVESGIIKNKMNLSVLPIKKELKVVNIFDNKDNKVAYATPGENIKLQITGVEEDMIKRGSVLCGLKYHCYVVHEFIAEFSSLDLGENMIITKGFTTMMHMHTILELVTITKIIHVLDHEGNIVKRKNNTLKSLTKGLIKIKVERPIAVEKYSEFPELGRFTLRQGSKTIGIGTVHKVKPLDNDYIYNSYFLNKEPEIDINDIGAIDLNNDRLDNIAEMEEGEDI